LGLADVTAGDEASRFLPLAVQLANSATVTGSLSCSVLVPDAVVADAAANAAVEEAVAQLKFGTVCVNVWSVMGYTTVAKGGVWGGHPADGPDGARSGCGFIGNLYGTFFPLVLHVTGHLVTWWLGYLVTCVGFGS
jgi:hypothetical protein